MAKSAHRKQPHVLERKSTSLFTEGSAFLSLETQAGRQHGSKKLCQSMHRASGKAALGPSATEWSMSLCIKSCSKASYKQNKAADGVPTGGMGKLWEQGSKEFRNHAARACEVQESAKEETGVNHYAFGRICRTPCCLVQRLWDTPCDVDRNLTTSHPLGLGTDCTVGVSWENTGTKH